MVEARYKESSDLLLGGSFLSYFESVDVYHRTAQCASISPTSVSRYI